MTSVSFTGCYEPVRTLETVESVYIPVKEMLSNAPGFRSLYAKREVHFEEVYWDILDRAYLPALRGPMDRRRERILSRLREAIGGEVAVKGEEFFLRSEQGDLEFSLLAEGVRKLALLWLLIRNGTLQPDSVLFWDEPETNLNPKLFGVVMDVLLELQRPACRSSWQPTTTSSSRSSTSAQRPPTRLLSTHCTGKRGQVKSGAARHTVIWRSTPMR